MLALEERAAELANLVRCDDEAESVVIEADDVAIRTASAQFLTARLVVGADGRHSLCREAAGIAVTRRDLTQTALTFNVGHARPHRNVSTEFHTPHGPCVFVPLPGDRSSIVWVSAPPRPSGCRGLSDAELSAAIEKQSHSILGTHARSSRAATCFRSRSSVRNPSGATASRWSAKPPMCSRRSARRASTLVCAMPPTSPTRAAKRIAAGEDPGAPTCCKRYDPARRAGHC